MFPVVRLMLYAAVGAFVEAFLLPWFTTTICLSALVLASQVPRIRFLFAFRL